MTLTLDLCKRLCEKEPEKFGWGGGHCLYIGDEPVLQFDDDGTLVDCDSDSCDRLCAELGFRLLLEYSVLALSLYAKVYDLNWIFQYEIQTNESEKLPASIAATAEIIRRVVE